MATPTEAPHGSTNGEALRRPLRVAFVGGAYESAVGRVHRTAIEMDQRYRLVAGCFSRRGEVSRSSALKYGIDPDHAYCDLGELLKAEAGRVDAVAILTPQDQHAAQVCACIDAGVPVICEKALATSTKEAVTIRDLLDDSAGFLAVTYNYTGYPMLRELKRMIENGKLGAIQQVHMEMPQEGFAKRSVEGEAIVPQEWRLRDGEIPTISLDLGVHLHMMARFLTGQEPRQVVATSDSYGNFSQIADNITALVRYANGMVGSIWYGKTAFGYRNGLKIRVFGERGAAEWVQEFPERLRFADNVGNRFEIDRGSPGIEVATQCRYQRFKVGHPAGFIEAFANYYCDVADLLEAHFAGVPFEGERYAFGIEESLAGLLLLDAMARSACTGGWENVE